jgi:HAD superfamily hydrolase (TIGR01549 family)
MKIKAIFYDFDGVIKDSTQIKTEAFYELYLPFGEEIAQKALGHHIAHGGISRFEKFKFYHATFLNITLTQDEIYDWAEKFSNLVLKKVIDSKYVPGAETILKTLSKEYDQYIITGTPKNEIDIILDELGLTNFFKEVYGSPENKVSITKHILKQQKYSSNEVLFIGDASTDYEAAKAFDIPFLLREHEENIELFSSIDVVKTKDLTDLKAIIKNIETCA